MAHKESNQTQFSNSVQLRHFKLLLVVLHGCYLYCKARFVSIVVVLTVSFAWSPLAAQVPPARPNFLIILMDDMTPAMLQHMPRTTALVWNVAREFPNAVAEFNLCAPSRATLLAGRYSQNTEVRGLVSADRMHQLAPTSMGALLQVHGYRTGLFGKYTNHYEWNDLVPPGWTRWVVAAQRPGVSWDAQRKRDPYLSVDGHPEMRTGWTAEITGGEALQFMQGPSPWLVLYAPTEPHLPHAWPSRHSSLFTGARALPRDARFNEADVSDKPAVMRLPLLTTSDINTIDTQWRGALRSIQRVDEQIGRLVSAAQGNTFIIFASDNGYFYGSHRRPNAKEVFYISGATVPFMIAGPGIGPRTGPELVSHVDVLPTVLELAGAPRPSFLDGRSLVPLLHGSATTWRHALPQCYMRPNWGGPAQAVRTDRYSYHRYASGAEELYDLQVDPLQLQNRASRSAYAERKTKLRKLTNDLATCAGATCRTIDARVIN